MLTSVTCGKLSDTLPTTTPDFNFHDGSLASTPAQKASVLDSFYASCFNQSFPPLTLKDSPILQALDCTSDLLCTEDEVLKMLCTLDILHNDFHAQNTSIIFSLVCTSMGMYKPMSAVNLLPVGSLTLIHHACNQYT